MIPIHPEVDIADSKIHWLTPFLFSEVNKKLGLAMIPIHPEVDIADSKIHWLTPFRDHTKKHYKKQTLL